MQTIRFFRNLRGLEQKDLAKVVGKTPTMICRYERGKAPITATDLQKIADFLQIPIEQFFEPIDSLRSHIASKLNKQRHTPAEVAHAH